MNWERDERLASAGLTAPGISNSCIGRRIQVKMDGIYLLTYNAYPDPDAGYSADNGDYVRIRAVTVRGEECGDEATGQYPRASASAHFHLATDQTIFTELESNIPWVAKIGVHYLCPWIPPSCG